LHNSDSFLLEGRRNLDKDIRAVAQPIRVESFDFQVY
jgi:hypothetical protein